MIPPKQKTRKGLSKGGYSTVSPEAYLRFWEKDAVCHSCAFIYALDERKTCPRCNVPFDPEKQPVARKRENTAYLERFSPEERKKILRRRKYGPFTRFDFRGVDNKLMKYLNEKRGKRKSPFNRPPE